MISARLMPGNLPFSEAFDMAIILCEGGFPFMETDEMNFQILQSAAKALKPGEKFNFTTLNGLFPHLSFPAKFYGEAAQEGGASYEKSTFDLMTFRDHNITVFEDDDRNKKELVCNERHYIPSEITWLLKSLGFKTIDIFGAKLGTFSRNNSLTPDDFEMRVVAEK